MISIFFCLSFGNDDIHQLRETSFSPARFNFKLKQKTKISTYLKTAETGSTWQCDVTDVGRRRGRHRFVNDEGSIFQIGPSSLFHLPELLQRFHHVHYFRKRKNKKEKLINTRSTAIDCTTFKFRVSFVSLPSLRARVFLYSLIPFQIHKWLAGIKE